MIRKIISIIFYSFAGFFLLGVGAILFADNKEHIPFSYRLGIAGFLFALGLLLSFIGILFSGLKNWQRDLGALFITITIFQLFSILSFICMVLTPDLRSMMPKDSFLYSQSSLLLGISYIIFIGLAGVLLLMRYKQKV
jgi:hypothetical protein